MQQQQSTNVQNVYEKLRIPFFLNSGSGIILPIPSTIDCK